MKCTIKIDMDNDSFKGIDELSRILRKLAVRLYCNIVIDNKTRLMDINGNNVGYCYIDKD